MREDLWRAPGTRIVVQHIVSKVDVGSITGLSRGLGQLIRWRGCIKVTRKEPMTQDRSNETCEVKFSAGGPERGRLRKNLKRKAMCAQDEWP